MRCDVGTCFSMRHSFSGFLVIDFTMVIFELVAGTRSEALAACGATKPVKIKSVINKNRILRRY